MIISYPVTKVCIDELEKYPWIKSKIDVSEGSRDKREIIRLLINTHYSHIETLLNTIETYGPKSGEVGDQILATTDPLVFPRYVAELYLFKYLFDRFGDDAQATISPKMGSIHDIDLTRGEKEYRFEVYSPNDIHGFAVFERLLQQILKFHIVKRGYLIEVKGESETLFYTQDFPPFREANEWAETFNEKFGKWIENAGAGDAKTFDSPFSGYSFTLVAKEIIDDEDDRVLIIGGATSSTDTMIYFEIEEPQNFLVTKLGRNLVDKVAKQQAGPIQENVTRVLFINLALANTTDLSWTNHPKYIANIEKHFNAVCADIEPYPPYEALVLCWLSNECEFVRPVFFEHGGFKSGETLNEILEYKVTGM